MPVLLTKKKCMKALEFRIGNYVDIEGAIAMIKAINGDGDSGSAEVLTTKGKTMKIQTADIKPVALTTELLKDSCGFNDFGRFKIGVDDHIYFLEFSNGYISLLSRDGEPVIYFMDIRNLHQLQNLHYALKGEEMKIAPFGD